MHVRAFRRAVALGAAALLLATTVALADSVQPSTDGVTVDAAGHVDAGTAAPGATVTVDVPFEVVCNGSTHVDAGTNVSLSFFTAGVDATDGSAAGTSASVGPAPSGWPADGTGCASPPQSFGGAEPSHVTITAPTTPSAPGQPYTFTLWYQASSSKLGAITTQNVFAYVDLAVSGDQPPVLDLPTDMTVEGNTIGGATVTYAATATDAEDTTAPTPTCSPASGFLFPLGTTTVSCSATDSANQTTTGSFKVTVDDTTPPAFDDAPPPITVTTDDPSGTTVTYALPTASDIVDPAPVVACLPASGSQFPTGSTSVTCTATDQSQNQVTASFAVTVDLVRPGATFEAPIGPTNELRIHPGRTLPVKATVTADGLPVTTGDVMLALSACGAGPLRPPLRLAFVEGRWFLDLDTSGLSGCTLGTLLLGGHTAGSFQMDGSGSQTSAGRPRRP